MQKRIAITGIGMVTPLGHDTQSSWQALLAGEQGVKRINSFDASRFPTQIAAEVKDFQFKDVVNKKLERYTVNFTRFALTAAEQALDDAAIRPNHSTEERWGCVVGSGMMTAEYEYWLEFQKQFAKDGVLDYGLLAAKAAAGDFYRSTDFGKTTANTGLSLLLQQHGIRGYANSVHTACASGGQALGLAMRVIHRGDADYVLTGGFDSMINPMGLASFCLLGALSTDNDTPEGASRPFNLTRNGFVLGEGAAFLVLESFDTAKARGAKLYAELAGEGNSLSCYRITDSPPDGDGAIQALRGALQSAGETIDAVDYINAHGTSTKMNDLSETNAIKAVFKERAKHIPTSSTKSQTGHLIAAAGSLEGAFTALAIHHGQLPMTANLNTPDPDCDLDYITEGVRKQTIRAAISNSFGFGGSNSCLLFRHPDYERVQNGY